MLGLEAQIQDAEQIFDRVRQEEEARSELIELADICEEEPYSTLRRGLRDIDELAAKIKERGQLVPILVWLKRGRYVLLSGHRRVAALRLLGVPTVKAIVYGDRDLSQQDALDIAIDDNVDRNNFSKAEMSALVCRLVDSGLTQRKISTRLRLSSGTVSDHYRLNTAPDDIKAAVDDGKLAMRAGLRLLKEPDNVRADVLAHADEGMLSFGDVSRLLVQHQPKSPAPSPVPEPSARRSNRARRGAAWSRETSVESGLVWQRTRDGDREIRFRIPANLSDVQRQSLRKFLLDQVRGL